MAGGACYPYLRASHNGPAVEDDYEAAALEGRLVVRDEAAGCFRVFNNSDDFWDWQDTLAAARRRFHEVIFGGHPQRLKFDIDAPCSLVDEVLPAPRVPAVEPSDDEEDGGGDDDACREILDIIGRAAAEAAEPGRDEKVWAFLERFVEVVLEELYLSYGQGATRRDIALAEACGPGKYSFHLLVLPYAVADHGEAKEFTRRVVERLSAGERRLVDEQVNSRLQNFRLPGSHKDGRVKRLVPATAKRLGTARLSEREAQVAPPPGARVLGRLTGAAAAPGDEAEPADAEVRLLLEAAQREGATEGHAFQRAVVRPAEPEGGTGGRSPPAPLLLFRRLEPTRCRICRRTHENENSLMLTARVFEGAWNLVELCRRKPGEERQLVELPAEAAAELFGDAPGQAAEVAEGAAARELRRLVTALAAGRRDPHTPTLFEELPHRQVYAAPTMRDFELAPTLAVRAQMGVGKTQALRRYLERLCGAPERELAPAVVRVVTFRQTFSRSLHQTLEPLGFTLYNEVAGPLTATSHPRLIVQSESLHRVAVGPAPEPADLLVLDEAESILAQFDSGLHRDFEGAFAVFAWLVRTSHRLVALDANLGDRTYRVLEGMRGGGEAWPPRFHWNRYRLAAERGDLVRATTDRGAWLATLMRALARGERLVVPTNSLAEATATARLVEERHPRLTVRLYTSRTPEAEKTRDFADVGRAWRSVDVLIYTPTLSAGVSFEAERFDALYGYFTDASCDVETCRQMMGRVRSLSKREMCLCLLGQRRRLPTDPGALERLAGARRGALQGAPFEYDPTTGQPRLYRTPYHRLRLENERVVNLSRSAFVARFLDQLADTGAAVELLEDPSDEERGALQLARRETRRQLEQEACAGVANAEELEPEQADAIGERIREGAALPDERLAHEKYWLRRVYRWEGEITADFVRDYQRAAARRVYRNLRQICAAPTVAEALRRLQQDEAAHHAVLTGGGESDEVRDLRTRYRYWGHELALWLVRLCGFACLFDPTRLREEGVYALLSRSHPLLMKRFEAIAYEFGLRQRSLPAPPPGDTDRAERAVYLRGALRLVNGALRHMYGREVRRSRREAGGRHYQLAWTAVGKLFTFDEGDAGRPCVPSHLRPLAPAPTAEALNNHHYDGDGSDGEEPAV
jgi:hypothetical protein